MPIIMMFVIFCIGMVLAKSVEDKSWVLDSKRRVDPADAHYKEILDQMNAENIKRNLRYLSEYPHHPGSGRSTELAETIVAQWKSSGFDKTEIFRYNILMSYPMSPGNILLRERGTVVQNLTIDNEPPCDDSEKKGEPLYPFHAFSPKGTVTAEYVYGNYGRTSDFAILRKLEIEMTGKIMIFRYGKGYRGSKVRRAENHGAVGVVIFSDPFDHTYPGKEYPNGWMLNKHGVQRGTVNRLSGDALSIGYPSKPKYFRKSAEKYSGNPTIPSQPISYGTAYELLSFMQDDSVPLPTGFQGGLNFTYVLSSGKDRTMTLKVFNEVESRESLTVCASLFGSEEPDRYVVIGNHRDSWTYGASDASSGTAAMMELVRTFGHMKKKTGWRPRRSIMACSWGAEEVGVQGSTEWADENHRFISEKVVGYINIDMAVEGNYTVRLKALEFIEVGIYKSAKLVNAPDDPNKTLYEDWYEKSKILADDESISKPFFITPVSGSDYKAFWHTYGTTISDLRYLFSKKDYPMLGANGHYHTLYESFGWMTKHVDPTFRYHLAIGKLWAGYCLIMGELAIIPYDLVKYTKQVQYFLDQFEETHQSILTANEISLSFLRDRLDALIKKTENFHDYINSLDLAVISQYELRSINDKLANFERNFLVTGISSRTSTRHVIYASASSYFTRATKFPGISEAIYTASKKSGDDWDNVRKQITLVIWCLDTANRSLDFEEWRP